MRLHTDGEMKLAQQAFESGDFDRAAELCCQMMNALASWPKAVNAAAGFHALLIDCLIETHSGDDIEPILKQFDQLFRDRLTHKDRTSAANTLIRKARFLLDLDYSQSLECGLKVVELFAASNDAAVLDKVIEAFDFLHNEMSPDDARFMQVCVAYASLLQNPVIDCHVASSIVANISETVDGKDNLKLIEITESFLAARSKDLTEEDRALLQANLAAGYLNVGQDEAAINMCSHLLVHGEAQSRLLYLLWCGTAFMNLGKDETAGMYFREVLRAASDSWDKHIAACAREYMSQIEAVE
jgi:tetratricopeptide (TPR) repeat protein